MHASSSPSLFEHELDVLEPEPELEVELEPEPLEVDWGIV